MSFTQEELKNVGFNLTQRKALMTLNDPIQDTTKVVRSFCGDGWQVTIDLPSIAADKVTEVYSEAVVPSLKILLDGIKKEFSELDADCIYAVVHEIGGKKTIKLSYDQTKTGKLADGCLAVAYESECIVIYWRILNKMAYPHCGHSITDYVLRNCSGPDELLSSVSKPSKSQPTLQPVFQPKLSDNFYETFQEKAPKVLSPGWIGITYYSSIQSWKRRDQPNERVQFACLRASEIVMVVPFHFEREHCSEITTKRAGKYYLSYSPDNILEALAESEKK